MDTKEFRFATAVIQCEHLGPETISPAVAGWRFTKMDAHPIDGHPVALGVLEAPVNAQYGYTGSHANFAHARARLMMAATRTGSDTASIEVSTGLEIQQQLQNEHRVKLLNGDDYSGLIASWETARRNNWNNPAPSWVGGGFQYRKRMEIVPCQTNYR